MERGKGMFYLEIPVIGWAVALVPIILQWAEKLSQVTKLLDVRNDYARFLYRVLLALVISLLVLIPAYGILDTLRRFRRWSWFRRVFDREARFEGDWFLLQKSIISDRQVNMGCAFARIYYAKEDPDYCYQYHGIAYSVRDGEVREIATWHSSNLIPTSARRMVFYGNGQLTASRKNVENFGWLQFVHARGESALNGHFYDMARDLAEKDITHEAMDLWRVDRRDVKCLRREREGPKRQELVRKYWQRYAIQA